MIDLKRLYWRETIAVIKLMCPCLPLHDIINRPKPFSRAEFYIISSKHTRTGRESFRQLFKRLKMSNIF